MTNQPIRHIKSEDSLDRFAREFLEVLLQDEACYLWNPAEPETEAYFERLEQNFSLLDSLDSEEIAPQAEKFYDCLHQCWESAEILQAKQSILQRFGHLVPCDWIDAIAEQAARLIAENLSPIERLVACVNPLLSNWGEEDLQVFARPLVYTMRGDNGVKVAPWDELSEIEKVRLTMKIAQEVLTELQQTNQ
ncbi:hypothetical protein NIES593_06320 [Hydrococcus rivularis NIES-593]|uniref:Uncharacterized protein n=1 Tax=Hydrococcus rivularis NIES-593 TaxID=1921803 RepID=A0A1U7HMQ7_9CYAN|nr:hypothetical protein [Hydrococcus rivularis]OKH24828.1 hypothetical protein NIES593_06320 [Hydrococcus rivularis NIES-593]